MPKFNFFTAFHNALSDPKAYSSFQKEMNSKAVEQTFFNSFAGKSSFRAVVLPENLSSASNRPPSKIIRVRPLDIHDFILPEPCMFTGDGKKILKVLSMHPVAYPDSSYPFLGGNLEEVDPVGYGHIVECYFKDGPQVGGRTRGLTYRPATIGLMKSFNLACLGVEIETGPAAGGTGDHSSFGIGATAKRVSSAQKNFKRAQYKPYEPPPPGIVLGPFTLSEDVKKHIEDSTIENIETYKTINGRTHSPLVKTYKGKVEKYKGQSFKCGLLPTDLLGQLPPGVISPASRPQSKGMFLLDVIEDMQRLAMAFEKEFGKKLVVNDSYRTFNRQIGERNRTIRESRAIRAKITPDMSDAEKAKINKEADKRVGYASKPGTSNHGWGMALDISTAHEGKVGFASDTYNWMLVNAPRFNFENPPGLRNESGVEEAWHFQWRNLSSLFS